MGADLILGVLEIQKGQAPDFEASEKHIRNLDEATLQEVLEWHGPQIAGSNGMSFRLQDFIQEDSSEPATSEPFKVDEARQRLLDDCQTLKEAWSDGRRTIVRMELHQTEALITGEVTWGDPVETVHLIDRFIRCGAAEKAGFIV